MSEVPLYTGVTHTRFARQVWGGLATNTTAFQLQRYLADKKTPNPIGPL